MENLIAETEVECAKYSQEDKNLYITLSQNMPIETFSLYFARSCEKMGLNSTSRIIHGAAGGSYSMEVREISTGDRALFQISPIRIKFREPKNSDLIHLIGNSIARVIPSFDVSGLIMGSSRNYELALKEGDERLAHRFEALVQ
jgi:hypothetical protein